jgi:hypothetical protein
MLLHLYYPLYSHVGPPELFHTLIPNNCQTPFESLSYPTSIIKADQIFSMMGYPSSQFFCHCRGISISLEVTI